MVEMMESFCKGLLFPKRQVLNSPKLKEFVDNNFKLNENGRKFSKQVEHIVGKGEIARNEQFLLFPQCFQKTCRHIKTRAFGKWLIKHVGLEISK